MCRGILRQLPPKITNFSPAIGLGWPGGVTTTRSLSHCKAVVIPLSLVSSAIQYPGWRVDGSDADSD
jgi:hypothetical protein